MQIVIANNVILRVSCINYLGVFVDGNLTWKSHLQYLEIFFIKFVGIFYKRRNLIPEECRRNLYFALVHSSVMCDIKMYNNTFKIYIMSRLEIINNKILQILQFESKNIYVYFV